MAEVCQENQEKGQDIRMQLINYKATVQYEGTRYKGWQKQPGTENTIQGKLETLLARLLETPVEVYGAGRTDAGVHALGQTASFRVPEESLTKLLAAPPAGLQTLLTGEETGVASSLLPSGRKAAQDQALFTALNHYLPDDIAISRLVRASDRFHARYLTSSKWYRYQIRTNPVSDVVNRRFLWQYGEALDVERMKEAAGCLTGRHDFASFCGLKMKKSTVRTVSKIDIHRSGNDLIILDYYGDGFLNHMVRLMTGELVEAGAGRQSPEAVGEILAQCRKGAASHTAPASGLTLMEVRY